MKLQKIALPLLKIRRRKLKNRIDAMDKLVEDGKIEVEAAVRACQIYERGYRSIQREIVRRLGKGLTHQPFAILKKMRKK